ncbi:MAG: hypothetical protein JNM62_14395 [Flavobacteriales bacterium]|nr:hypothetical protein [Flavobacteriales bacterium]
MHPVPRGLHCAKCDHDVIDFTAWTLEAVHRYHAVHPGTCGMFTTEQVEPELRPLVELLSPKAGLLVASLFFTPVVGVSQQSAVPNSEQVFPVDRPSTRETKVVSVNDERDEVLVEKAWDRAHISTTWPRYRIYFSKRFPFLHIRKRLIMGCPSF